MKTAAVLAELNPLHNGHARLFRLLRENAAADRIVVLLGGDFTQRGVPALVSQRVRAEMALRCGADLVLAYPVRYATASAESYAHHAMAIFDALGCVDLVGFGSECGNSESLKECARILNEEPADYKTALRDGLRGGLSFPKARAAALPEYAELLAGPNNILAVEYLRSLLRLESAVEPFAVLREGSGHREETILSGTPSATAIRNRVLAELEFRKDGDLSCADAFREELSRSMPEASLALLLEALRKDAPLTEEDFTLLLSDRLLRADAASLGKTADFTPELANAALAQRSSFRGYAAFAETLSSKNRTRAQVNRALLHLLLGIEKGTSKYASDPLFAHVVGFRKEAEELLSVLKKNARIPVVTRIRESEELDPAQRVLFEEDLYAASLCENVRARKTGRPAEDPRTQPVIVI